jgi:CRISPR-associated Csx10 family RAMP protein
MMNTYRLLARLISPLSIAIQRQSQIPLTLTYIPGRVLRGGLAEALIREGHSPSGADFQSLFGPKGPVFPDLIPAENESEFSRVLPLTARSCKRYHGFRADDGHGAFDLLAVKAAKTMGAYASSPTRCAICDQDLKAFVGFWNGDVSQPSLRRPITEIRMHTGIDRATGTVAEGILYGNEVIRPITENSAGIIRNVQFTGISSMTDEQFKIFSRHINLPIFLGADKTRGYGEVCLELLPANSQSFNPMDWDQEFKNLLRNMKVAINKGCYFSVTLRSDAILVDKFLRPTSRLPVDDWHGVELVCRTIKSTLVRSWSSGYGLPKPDDPALNAGSVFLYRYEGDDNQLIMSQLQSLAAEGIGLRRQEGLGAITVCDPFHIQADGR